MIETVEERKRRLRREKQARYVARHPDRVKATQAKWYAANAETKREASREHSKTRTWSPERNDWQNAYRAKNREDYRRYHREYKARRRQTDRQFVLAELLRSRLGGLRRGQRSPVRDLGCSIAELILHLERQFTEGMSWDNRGQWHIDHKRPLSSFDLTDDEQFLQACHFSNLQPLWASDNLAKGAKVVIGG